MDYGLLDSCLIFLLFFMSVSAWFFPSRWTLGLVLGGVALGVLSGRLGLPFVGAFALISALVYVYNHTSLPRPLTAVVAGVIFCGAILIYLHYVPGVKNFKLVDGVRLNSDSLPFHLYLNIDKTLVGYLLFASLPGMIAAPFLGRLRAMLKVIAPVTAFVVVVLIGVSYGLNYVRLDIKFPEMIWLWAPINLLFVCAAEEVLFRGFVQKELTKAFAHYPWGQCVALGVAALLFGAYHYPSGGLAYMVLSSVAGLGYGYAYQRTGDIRASMLTHFLVNLVHFLFFSYPALAKI